MGQPSLWKSFKEWVGGIAFDVFLWAYEMSEVEYLAAVYEDAVREYQSEKKNAWTMK